MAESRVFGRAGTILLASERMYVTAFSSTRKRLTLNRPLFIGKAKPMAFEPFNSDEQLFYRRQPNGQADD